MGRVDKLKNKIIKTNYLSIYLIVIIFSVISFFSVYYVLQTSLKRDIQFTTKEYIESKKETIKNQVNNLVNYIKFVSVEQKKKDLNNLLLKTDFMIHLLKMHSFHVFKSFLLKTEYNIYNVLLIKNGKIVYKKGFIPFNEIKKIKPEQINEIKIDNNIFYVYLKKFKKNNNNYILINAITQKAINSFIKRKIVELINSLQFVFKNGYMSIIKLYNVKGGKRFAKFIAYPRNPMWEGLYLNDTKKDAKGREYRKIYLRILRKQKSGFFVYWFRKNGKLYQKISYVKLFKPFKWAVFGGVYIDSVNNIINRKKKLIKNELSDIFKIYAVVSILFLIFVYFITRYETRLLEKIIEDYEKNISIKNKKLKEVNSKLDLLNQNLQKKVEEKTEELLKSYFTDNLTNLPNREKFMQDFNKYDTKCIAVLNIDQFKEINNFYGIEIGDHVIKKVAEILSTYTDVYKLSADEFGIISYDCKELYKTVKKLVAILEKKYLLINGLNIEISVSAGIGKNITDADLALKHAKDKSKGKAVLYDDNLDVVKKYKEYIEWKNIIKEAINKNDIIPFVQPIVDSFTCEPVKYEVLMRLKYKNKYYPPFFLDYAKKAGLYIDLQKIVIQKSFEIFSTLNKKFSINLSAMELTNSSFKSFLLENIDKYNVKEKLTIELLEDEKLKDEEMLGFLIYLHEVIGIEIAIDDFGAGNSNISYLVEKFPVTILKIDGSLIKDIEKNENNRKLIKVIINMAKIFNLTTIAEFVENQNIANMLRDYGIDALQGYYFSKPFNICDLKDE